MKCHVWLSSAKFQYPLKKTHYFTFQEQWMQGAMCSEHITSSKEAKIYYLSRCCSRPGVKLRFWLLITLQFQGWQEEKLSVLYAYEQQKKKNRDEYLPASAWIPTWEQQWGPASSLPFSKSSLEYLQQLRGVNNNPLSVQESLPHVRCAPYARM